MTSTPNNSAGDLLLQLVADAVRAVVREELAGLKDELASLQPAAPVGKWMTVGEAAGYAGVTEGTIREWINRGKLSAVKAGQQWRVKPTALDAAMQAGARDDSPNLDAMADNIVALAGKRK